MSTDTRKKADNKNGRYIYKMTDEQVDRIKKQMEIMKHKRYRRKR